MTDNLIAETTPVAKKSMWVGSAVLMAHLVITLPIVIILLAFVAAGLTVSVWLVTSFGVSPSASMAAVGVLMLLGSVVGWLWWSYAIPAWRRWADRKGVPADQLHKWALMTGLVWPKGWIFEKTELKLLEYAFTLPGFEGHQFTLQPADAFSAPRLLIDGEPAPKGSKRNSFVLQPADGPAMVAQLRMANSFDPVPQLIVDGQKIEIAPPVRWWEWIFAGLPLLLLPIGGLLGGLAGATGMLFNGRLLRSGRNAVVKYLLIGMVSLLTVVSYFALVALYHYVTNGPPKTTTDVRSEQGRFSVTSPVPLEEMTKTLDNETGPLDVHSFAGGRGQSAFVIMYSDYPIKMIQQQGAERTLDNIRDEAGKNSARKLISETEITLSGYPGREWLIQLPPENGQEMIFRERIFLVENRLYQVIVVVVAGHETHAAIESFLNSFKLLPPN